MSPTKWTQIEKSHFQFTKHCDVKYSHAHQVLNISYSDPLDDIEYLFLDNTRTEIAPGAASMIKGKIIAMATSLANDTSDLLQITNLLNKCTMYTTDKEGDSQTLRNDGNFKSILKLKDAFKDNIDRIHIYLNINNLNFKPSFKPERFEDISEDPFPTSGPTPGSVNSNPGTGPQTQQPSINLPPNVVTAIEDIPKAIQKYTNNQPSTGITGAATTTSTIFNHAALTNDVKDRYLDKGNPQILMTGNTMKPFNDGFPDPSYPSGTTMLTQEYHLGTPVTGEHIFTRDGTYFQLIKQDAARDKQFVCLVPAQDVQFFYTRSHLSALQNCALLFSTNFQFIFIF